MTKTYSGRIAFMLFLLFATLLARAAGPAVHVDPLPPGWKAGQFDTNTLLTGSSSELEAHFELEITSKNTIKGMDLARFAAMEKKREAKDSAAQTDRKETELTPVTLGDHKSLQYEITGTLFGLKLHWRTIFVEVGDSFCNIRCWAPPAHWEAANPQFDMIVKNIK
jgi:hypothetical protein